ncbi:hypothetical protein HPB48_007517 [Haemaphysalis longicornis]|uniref:Ionotropic receptor n=1 Tax=Haemaphysalis longicornis TaxID=44386 RepID=A0A9J6GWM4_HAELO|nr:hypothetical protein HPB48_007517 [Haemaphysalis longicornis]
MLPWQHRRCQPFCQSLPASRCQSLPAMWQPFYASLLKNSLIKVTVWSHDKTNLLYVRLLNNSYDNKKTAVVFPTVSEGQNACLLESVARRHFFLSVDWIVFNDDVKSITKMKTQLRYLGRYPACVVPHMSAPPKFDVTTIEQEGAPVVFSRRCLSPEREWRSTWSEAFNGATISAICYPKDTQERKTNNRFKRCYSDFVYKALQSMNATIIFKDYKGIHDIKAKVFLGEVDIIVVGVQRVRFVSTPAFCYPHIVYYRYERFYTHSEDEKRLVSSFMLLGHSKMVLLFLVFSALAVWLALIVAASVSSSTNLSRRVNSYVIGDSATFIVSSLLSTSTSTLFDEAISRSRSFGAPVGIVLAVWLLGMIPLCDYFRAVLTSRLAVYVSQNPVDTLNKLEAQLDLGMIQPCVVKGNSMHYEFLWPKLSRSSIYGKLRVAYYGYHNVTGITFDNFEQCWLHCAKRQGFVCIHDPPHHLLALTGKNTVESREHLGLGFYSAVVRKDFPKMRAYQNLLRRMAETALIEKFTYYGRNGGNKSAIEGQVNDKDEVAGTEEPLKLSELWSFWICFVALHLFSVIVCCLETAIAHNVPARFISRFKLVFVNLLELRITCTVRSGEKFVDTSTTMIIQYGFVITQ